VGLNQTSYDSLLLDANNPVVFTLFSSDAAPAYPDPKESWYEEVRIADDASCDDVVEMEAAGDLGQFRPF
jgi:hypothetical protein